MNTRATDILLEIMGDPELPTRRRMQAAEALLGFEAPVNVINHAREYLASVFENREGEKVEDRMEAAQITRKFEAKKIAPQTVHLTRREEVDRKEAWREYHISQRQIQLVLATMDHPPPGWDSDLRSPDYLPPPGDAWPPSNRGPDGKLILFRPKERG
jgi:hypothetical protein